MGGKLSQESAGVHCLYCGCPLPPNNYQFEHIGDLVFAFFREHAPQQRYEIHFPPGPATLSECVRGLCTVTRTLEYLRPHSALPDGPYTYFCLSCFARNANGEQRSIANRLCTPGGVPAIGLSYDGFAGDPNYEDVYGPLIPVPRWALAGGGSGATGSAADSGGATEAVGLPADTIGAAAVAAPASSQAASCRPADENGENDGDARLAAPEFEPGFWYHQGDRVAWRGAEYVCRRSHEGASRGPQAPSVTAAATDTAAATAAATAASNVGRLVDGSMTGPSVVEADDARQNDAARAGAVEMCWVLADGGQ